MARARTVIVCGVCLFAATPAAWGACRFQNDEIVNPFEAGCGDVILTYTESDNTGNNIALGYPVPIPVDSLTPVDGFRTYDSLFARHQSLLTMHEEVDGQIVGQTVAGENIWAYRLGDADTTTAEGFAEGAVLVNGGIHAREWQTPEAVTGLMEAMVDGKADGGLRAIPHRESHHRAAAGEQRRRFPADPAVCRSHDRGSPAAARRTDAAQEHAQPTDPGRDRRGPGDGRRQLLGHRPQPQFARWFCTRRAR